MLCKHSKYLLNLSDKSAICLHFSGEKPFNCHLCSKAFSESCKLKRHLSRVHYIMKNGGIWLTEDMHGMTSVQVKPQSFAKSTIMMFTSTYYPTFSAFFNVKVYWHFPNIYSISINDPRMNDDWPQDFYEKILCISRTNDKINENVYSTWRFIKHVKAIVFEYLSKINHWNTK